MHVFKYMKPKTIIGVDISKDAVALCNSTYKETGLSFETGDSENLPFKENVFDIVINVESSHCYGDIRKLQADSLTTIIHESQVLREQCYKISNKNLSWRYFYKNKTLLERRLFEGGMRLSGILNRVYR